jgi:hypothetical protein
MAETKPEEAIPIFATRTAKREVPTTDAMMPLQRTRPTSSASVRDSADPQMNNRCRRIELKSIAGPEKTHGKIRFFSKSAAFVIFVHSANLEINIPSYGKIARNHKRSDATLPVILREPNPSDLKVIRRRSQLGRYRFIIL